jgi:thiamine pyrophosphokinase
LSLELAVVIANGAVPDRSALDTAWPGWSDGLGLVVGADGGAQAARSLGLALDVVVGDGDSLAADELRGLRAAGVEIEAWPASKDASDLELAVDRALRADPRRIVLLGAFGGGRLDHLLANVWLLGLPALRGRDATALDSTARIRVLTGPGRAELVGRSDDLVTLIPFGGDALGVTTDGLAYPLRDEPLPVGPSRGLSNVRTAPKAVVSIRAGRLLIIETHSEEEPQP